MAGEIEAAEKLWRTKYDEYVQAWNNYRDLCNAANQCVEIGCRESRLPKSHHCQAHWPIKEYDEYADF